MAEHISIKYCIAKIAWSSPFSTIPSSVRAAALKDFATSEITRKQINAYVLCAELMDEAGGWDPNQGLTRFITWKAENTVAYIDAILHSCEKIIYTFTLDARRKYPKLVAAGEQYTTPGKECPENIFFYPRAFCSSNGGNWNLRIIGFDLVARKEDFSGTT